MGSEYIRKGGAQYLHPRIAHESAQLQLILECTLVALHHTLIDSTTIHTV